MARTTAAGQKKNTWVAASAGAALVIACLVPVVALALAPDPPSELEVVAGTAEPLIATLSWTPSPDSQVVGYRVYNALEADGPYRIVAETTGTEFGFVDGIPGVPYYFRVRAYNAGGEQSSAITTGSVTATWSSSPHIEATAQTQKCSKCHSNHHASDGLVFRWEVGASRQVVMCLTCHDGRDTLAANVASGTRDSFSLVSGHTIETTPSRPAGPKGCASCHELHGSTERARMIPARKVNGTTVESAGPGWCLACHASNADWYGSGYPDVSAPIRNSSGYPVAGTWPGPATYESTENAHGRIPETTQSPGPGTPVPRVQGDCRYCHAAHRGPNEYDGLLTTFTAPSAATLDSDREQGSYAALCFTCHGGTVPSGFATAPVDILQFVTTTTASVGHRIVTSGGVLPVGAPLPCYECHGPHGSTRGNESLLSDERGGNLDTSEATGVRHFCFTCHSTADEAKGWDSSSESYVFVGSTQIEGIPRDGGVLRLPSLAVHQQSSSMSCYLCHGKSYAPGGRNVHAPAQSGGGDTGSHVIHTSATDPRGPGGLGCGDCHDVSNIPRFKDGQDLANTTACDTCHSPGGSYDGVTSANGSIGAKTVWETGAYETTSTLQPGKEKWCAGCHDGDPSDPDNEPSQVRGVYAPPIAGDESSSTAYGTGYGYYKTGHGLATDTAYPSSGGVSKGAGLACSACHEYGSAHIDGDARTYSASSFDGGNAYRSGYRLSQVTSGTETYNPMYLPWDGNAGLNASRFALCSSCHDPRPFVGENSDTNLRWLGDNYHVVHLNLTGQLRADSDWDGANDSRTSCPVCHNVHGSKRLAMVNDGSLVGREPGIEVWYGNPDISEDLASNPFVAPEPQGLTLVQSTGITMFGASTGTMCSTCHTWNYTSWLPRDAALRWKGDSPALDWTWEPYYEGRGVGTDRVFQESYDATFRVKYFDPNNDPPSSVQVWVDLNDNSIHEPGETIAMAPASSDTTYTDGVVYTATVTVTQPVDKALVYRFSASDGTNTALGNPTNVQNLVWDDNFMRDVPGEYSTIQAAIDAAYDGNTVSVGDGTYAEGINYVGKSLTVISVNGAENTRITATTSTAEPCVWFASGETSAVLQGFTLDNVGPGDEPVRGVLIQNHASPTILDCVITGNVADTNAFGGGIKITGGGLTLQDTTVTANSARQGGGIYAEDCTQTISITDCTIDGNNGANGSGGGVCLVSVESTTTFTRTSVSGNTSDVYGGGIYTNNAAIELVDCAVEDNACGTASFESGGGLYLLGADSAARITGSTVSGNQCGGAGGGIFISGSTEPEPLVVTNSEISGNTSTGNAGGAVYISACTNPSVFTNVAIDGNTSYGNGGGIYSDSTVVLSSGWITNNSTSHSPQYGGGIYVGGGTADLTLTDTIVDGNQSSGAAGIYFGGDVLSITRGSVSSNTGAGVYDGGGVSTDSTATIYGTVIVGNQCGKSGAGVFHGAAGTLTMTNCTVAGNTGGTNISAAGGGVRCGNAGDLILNCTVAGNFAREAGGIWSPAGASVSNCAVWGNVTQGSVPNIQGATVRYTDTSGGGFTDGGNNMSADPAFVDFKAASSTTPTSSGDYHLETGTPCEGAADPATAPGDDIDRESRPMGRGDDMGSDEVFVAAGTPWLEWTNEPGYASDGVAPDSGIDGSNFTFRTTYSDEDGDPPAYVKLFVDYDDNGSYESSESADMEVAGGDYTTGMIYTKTVALSHAGDGDLHYRFAASDGTHQAIGQATYDSTVTVTPVSGFQVPADYATIQAAIDAAAAGNTIRVAAGTYPENITFRGKSVTVTAVDGAAVTSIVGTSNASFNDTPVVTFATNETAASVLDGFTIDNNRSAGTKTRGVYISSASPTISDCVIKGNRLAAGTYDGAGVYIAGASGGATILDTTIGASGESSNTARAGAGIYVTGSTTGALTLTRCTLEYNNANNGSGGGIHIAGCSGPIAVTDTTITANTVPTYGQGGGIYGTGVSGPLTVSGSTISANRSQNGCGIYWISSSGSVTVTDTAITDNIGNTTSGMGGGIHLSSVTSTFTIGNSSIASNATTQSGAGIYATASKLEVYGSHINTNTVGSNVNDGGGVRLTTSSSAYLFDTSVNGNCARIGAGVLVDAGSKLALAGSSPALSTVNGNYSTGITGNGGGISVTGANSTLNMDRSTVSSNACGTSGGGVHVAASAAATITASVVTSNTSNAGTAVHSDGGGVYSAATLYMDRCTVAGNFMRRDGGGIWASTAATITNCAITGNRVGETAETNVLGGGVYWSGATGSIVNCTIAGNNVIPSAGGNNSGGLHCTGGTYAFKNLIVWGNYATGTNKQIGPTGLTVTYSDVEGGYAGTGNINSDPLFVSPVAYTSAPIAAGDYHLQSSPVMSPCQGVGTSIGAPSVDIDGEIRPMGTGHDMGSDEITQ